MEALSTRAEQRKRQRKKKSRESCRASHGHQDSALAGWRKFYSVSDFLRGCSVGLAWVLLLRLWLKGCSACLGAGEIWLEDTGFSDSLKPLAGLFSCTPLILRLAFYSFTGVRAVACRVGRIIVYLLSQICGPSFSEGLLNYQPTFLQIYQKMTTSLQSIPIPWHSIIYKCFI